MGAEEEKEEEEETPPSSFTLSEMNEESSNEEEDSSVEAEDSTNGEGKGTLPSAVNGTTVSVSGNTGAAPAPVAVTASTAAPGLVRRTSHTRRQKMVHRAVCFTAILVTKKRGDHG